MPRGANCLVEVDKHFLSFQENEVITVFLLGNTSNSCLNNKRADRKNSDSDLDHLDRNREIEIVIYFGLHHELCDSQRRRADSVDAIPGGT